MNDNFIYGAVVEDGVITNTLVFDNEETMREFNCLPLAPYQGIGDIYISPEDWSKQETDRELKAMLDLI